MPRGRAVTALYVFGALLVVLLVGVVLAPLVEREPPDEELEELPPDERREAAVEALAEVEFEYRTDKLSEEEYRRLRTRYGRIALAAEEAMEGGGPVAGGEGPASDANAAAADDARRGESPASAGKPDARSSGSCPDCGATVPGGASFCPRCGARQQGEHEET